MSLCFACNSWCTSSHSNICWLLLNAYFSWDVVLSPVKHTHMFFPQPVMAPGLRKQHTHSLCGEILNDTIMGVMRIYSSPSHLSFMNVSAGWEGAVLCCVCRPVKTRAWRAFAPERTSDHTTTDRIWPERLRFNILHWKMVSAPFYISPLTYKTGHACSHILIIAPPNAGRCIVFLKVMCQNLLQGVWEVARFDGSRQKPKRGRTFFCTCNKGNHISVGHAVANNLPVSSC